MRYIERGEPLARHAPNVSSSPEAGSGTVQISFPSIETTHASRLSWVEPLQEAVLAARYEGVVDNAIVHGSFGDHSYTEFSDLEITLLLSDRVFTSPEMALALRRWIRGTLNPLILAVDPLQHHGPFYLWPALLSRYSEAILPLAAYRSSWAVVPAGAAFTLHDVPPGESSSSLDATLNSLSNYRRKFFRHGVTPYAIKRLLSNIMLVPAFLRQRNGIHGSKPDAIAALAALDIPQVLEVMRLCTAYRAEWPKPPRWLGRARGVINRGYIPSGRLDMLITSSYRDRLLQRDVERSLFPIIPEFCRAIESLASADARF